MPSLDQLLVGQRGLIQEVSGGDALGQRLLEMGLLEGEPVEVLGFAPFGDPMEVRLRDYRLSLRKREAARVSVELRELLNGNETFDAAEENESQNPVRHEARLKVEGATTTVAVVGN